MQGGGRGLAGAWTRGRLFLGLKLLPPLREVACLQQARDRDLPPSPGDYAAIPTCPQPSSELAGCCGEEKSVMSPLVIRRWQLFYGERRCAWRWRIGRP